MTPNAPELAGVPPDTEPTAEATATAQTTTVEVHACGRFRREFDETRFEFTFEGSTLREFVGALLGERPELADLLIGETRREDGTAAGSAREDEAGWTDLQDAHTEGKRPFVRIMLNGTFNEYRGGADAELSDVDRVELVEPLTC